MIGWQTSSASKVKTPYRELHTCGFIQIWTDTFVEFYRKILIYLIKIDSIHCATSTSSPYYYTISLEKVYIICYCQNLNTLKEWTEDELMVLWEKHVINHFKSISTYQFSKGLTDWHLQSVTLFSCTTSVRMGYVSLSHKWSLFSILRFWNFVHIIRLTIYWP